MRKYVGEQGYYSEPDLGLQLLGQKWYDSKVGRFISRDLIGEQGGLNLYGYVRNNAVNEIDPYGLISWKCAGKKVGIFMLCLSREGLSALNDYQDLIKACGIVCTLCFGIKNVPLCSGCGLCIAGGTGLALHIIAQCIEEAQNVSCEEPLKKDCE